MKNYISDLAIADYHVSKWVFAFQEKETGQCVEKKEYVNKIINWILPELQP